MPFPIRRLAPVALAASAALAGCLTQDQPGQSASAVEGDVCGIHDSQFVDGHGNVWGTISVSNTDTDLVVEVDAALPGFHILDVYLDAENGPIVHATGGYVNYFAFPYQVQFTLDTMPDSYTFTIPLSQIGVTAGECASLNVAAYAVMKQTDASGNVTAAAHGWATGDNVCPMNNGDGCAWFTDDLCCDLPPPPPPPDAGCTLTQGYWKTHNEYAVKKPLKKDWPAPYDEDDQLCGQTLLSILGTAPRGDAWIILAHQFIAAELNIASGASTTPEVDQAMTDAAAFLDDHCGGVAAADAPEATDLATTLDDYNSGFIGPGHCD